MSNYRNTLLLPVLLLSMTAVSFGDIDRDKTIAELDDYLTAAQELWGFEGSVVIAVDGHTVLSEGYGYANRAFEISNDPNTKFYIGSITKQFTAGCILILKERGVLNLDDPIIKYLPDYPEEKGSKITIRQLLNHTSGLPNYTDYPEVLLKRMQPLSTAYMIDLFKNKPLVAAPGLGFHYSNSGYLLLGEIIERVSGQSYEAFLQHEILKPLGMNNSGYGRREAAYPNRADGYTFDRAAELTDALPVHLSVLHSAGAMYSTVEDMLKWDQALYEETVLCAASVREMFEPNSAGYGYGWYVKKDMGVRHAWHDGFLDGFNTMINRWIDHRLCIVVFSNDDNSPVDKISRGLAAIIYNRKYDFPVRKDAVALDPGTIMDYPGLYRFGEGCYINIAERSDKLYAFRPGEPMFRIVPAAIDTFFYDYDNTLNMIFQRDDSGRVVSLSQSDDGGEFRAVRIDDDKAHGFRRSHTAIMIDTLILDRYTGLYRLISDDDPGGDTGFFIAVNRQENLIIASVNETESVTLLPASETEFFHNAADFYLKFILDDSGRVTGCRLIMGLAEVDGRKVE